MVPKVFSVTLREKVRYTNEEPFHRETVMDAVGARGIVLCLTGSQRVTPHYHNHTDDIFVGIEGEGVIETERGPLSLLPGTCHMVAAGTRHAVRPVAGSSVAFLIIQNKPYDNVRCESV